MSGGVNLLRMMWIRDILGTQNDVGNKLAQIEWVMQSSAEELLEETEDFSGINEAPRAPGGADHG